MSNQATAENKFQGYKATFTNSETGKSYPCWVLNEGSAKGVRACKISVNMRSGVTSAGTQIWSFGAAKWVKASSVTRK